MTSGYDEDEHCKRVFARAGVALYQAQVLEAAFQHLLVVIGIVSGEVGTQSSFVELEEKLRGYTLGRLIRDFQNGASLTPGAEELVEKALERRNFLAHHFFKERAVAFMGRQGREAMVEELLSYEDLFVRAEALISAMGDALRVHIGVPQEKVQREFERLAREAR